MAMRIGFTTILVVMVQWPFLALSNDGIVEKIKGDRAVVKFESPEIEVGSVVTIKDDFDEFENSSPRDLRKRVHIMNWQYSTEDMEVKTRDGFGISTTSTTKTGELAFGYQYNWGRAQLGVEVGGSSLEMSSTKTLLTIVSLVGQLNLIENNPKNNFIPFARLNLGSANSEVTVSGTTSKGNGTYTGVFLGAYILPFSELFAIDISVPISVKGELSYDGGTKQEMSYKGINVGWSLMF